MSVIYGQNNNVSVIYGQNNNVSVIYGQNNPFFSNVSVI